jgi:hypothetical protein
MTFPCIYVLQPKLVHPFYFLTQTWITQLHPLDFWQRHKDGEKVVSSTNVAGKTGYLHAETEISSMPFTLRKYQLKWIKGLNVSPETVKFVWERVENTLELISISNDFLDRTQVVQKLRKDWQIGL